VNIKGLSSTELREDAMKKPLRHSSADVVGNFDQIVDQLRDTLSVLQHRVSSLTHDLQVAADVSQQVTSILSLDELLPYFVELTKSSFELYHAQVYLLDETGENLVMTAGAGEAGRQMKARGHHIPLNAEHSLVARAARSREAVIASDVKSDPDFLPNDLLPDTRSEMAIPMIVGDSLIGVLDVQADSAEHFTEDDIRVKTTLASQLAVAVQNAHSFQQLQQAEADTRRIYDLSVDMIGSASLSTGKFTNLNPAWEKALGWTTDELMAEPFINFVHPEDRERTLKEFADQVAAGKQSIFFENRYGAKDGSYHWISWNAIPVAEQGETYFVARDVTEQKTSEFFLRQSMKDVEDIRFAIDQHSIVAITDQTGKILYANDKFCEISKYSREELLGQDHRIVNSSYHPKSFIRDMWVTIANGKVWKGELRNRAKDGSLYWVDTTIVPFLNEEGKPYQYIAIRNDITERKRQGEELARRAAELQAVADVATATSSIRDVDELLQQVSDLTKERFNLYHAHVYLLDGETLRLAAGAGSTGRQMVANGHYIPLNHENSIVARAARERKGVIVNDVRASADFLANPMLPDTRSEMALPMVVGDHVIGVLDVQADAVDRFDSNDILVKGTLASQIAIALENARYLEQMSALLGQTETLYTASQKLNQANSYQDVLNVIVSATAIRNMTRASLTLFNRPWTDEAPELLVVQAAWERSGHPSISPVGTQYPVADSPAMRVYDRYKPLLSPDIEQDTRLDEVTRDVLLNHMGMRSSFSFPVTVGDQWLGFVGCQGAEVTHLTDDELRQINTLTTQAATIIQTLRILEATETARQHAETLAELNAALSLASDEDSILAALDELARQYHMNSSSLSYTTTDDEQHIVEMTVVGMRSGEGYPIPLSVLPTTRMLTADFPLQKLIDEEGRDGNPLFIGDIQTDPRCDENTRAFARVTNLPAVVLIPLRTGDQWYGSISLIWAEPQDYDERFKSLVRAITPPLSSVVAARRAYLRQVEAQRESERRARDLQIVAQVGSQIATNLNSQDLLWSIADLTQTSFKRYHVNIYLAEGLTLKLAAASGEVGRQLVSSAHNIPLNAERSLVARAARTRKPVVVADVTQEPGFLANPLLPETHSEVAIPIVFGELLIGVLDVQDSVASRFDETDVETNTILANQIAVAIENARAFDVTNRQLRELKARGQITEIIRADEGSLEDLLKEILAITRETFDASAVLYNTYDAKNGTIQGLIGIGESMPPEFVQAFREQTQRLPHVAEAIQTGNVVAVHDMRTISGVPAEYVDDKNPYSVLTMPIFSNDAVTGVVFLSYIGNLHTFTQEEIELARSIASQISVTVDRKRQEDAIRASQAQLQSILDNSTSVIYVKDRAGRYLTINRQYEEIFHITNEAIVGKSDFDLFPKEIAEEFWSVDRKVIETGEKISEQNVAPHDDGLHTYISSKFPLYDASGQIYAVCGISTDITQIKQQEEEIRTSQAQLQSILDNSTAVIYVKDRQGKYLTINRRYEQLFHITNEQIRGKTDYDLFPKEVADALWSVDGKIVETGEKSELQEVVPQDDGPHTYVSSKFPLYDANGEIYALCGISTDITPLMEKEAALRENERRYQQIMDGVSDLILVKGEKSRIVWANKAFRDYYGMDDEQLRGMIDAPFSEPDYTQKFIQDDEYVWHNKVPLHIPEEPVNRYDGAVRLFETVKTPIFNEKNEVFLTVGVSRDVTDRKLAEEEQRILYTASDKLAKATTRDELLEAVSEYGRQKDAFGASLFYIDNDENDEPEWVEVVAEWHTRLANAPVGTRFHLPEYPFAQKWIAHPDRVVLTPDMLNDPSVDAATAAVYGELGIRGSALMPLTVKGRWVGLILFNWDTPQTFDERDARILTRLGQQMSAAVDAVRSFEQAQMARAEAEALYEGSERINTAKSLDEVLTAVVESTSLHQSDNAYLMFFNEPWTDEMPDGLIMAAGWSSTPPPAPFPIGMAFPIAQYPFIKLYKQHEPVIIHDVTTDPRLDEATRQLVLADGSAKKSLYTFPLIINGEWIGVLTGQSEGGKGLGQRHVRQITALLGQAASVIQNIRLLEQSQKRANELATVTRVSAQIATQLDPDNLLWSIAELTRANFNRYHVNIYILEDDELVLKAASGEAGRVMVSNGHRIPLNAERSLVARAARTHENVVIDNVTQEPGFLPNPLLPETRSELAVPILYSGQVIGVLDVQDNRTNTFNDLEIQAKTVLANQIAVAIENARAFTLVQQAEAQTRRIYEMSVDMIGSVGFSNGMFIDLNPAWERVLGWTLDELKAKPFIEFVHPDDRQRTLDEYAAEMAAGKLTMSFENRYMCKDGSYRWISWNAVPSPSEGYTYFVSRDVTEERRQAEIVQKRASELQTVAEVSAATASVLDLEKLLQQVTDLTKERFDLYHAHIYLLDDAKETLVLAAGAGEVGQQMKELGHAIALNHPHSLVARAARTRQGVIANDVKSNPDFLPNPLLPSTRSELAVPLIVGDELIGVMDVQSGVVNRFTEQDVRIKTTLADQIAVAVQNARAYTRQLETAERLREVDRLKSQFLANMSHELRTPLNSIIGYAEVLLDGIDGDLTDEAIEDVQAIHGGGKHLLSIINDILDLAKIEAGQMFMERHQADLPNIIDEVVHTLQILVKDKNIYLNVEQNGELPSVYGDAVRLRQIIFNLVNNAIKFTEKGGVTVEVGQYDASQVYVKVKDTGIGMDQKDLSVIFERFRQVDGSATRRAGGTGLGLAITRHLIHMHEGEIHVESEKGVGSTFWFTVPVYVAQKA
jgi:PAS domain S-box-containing protein